MNLLEPSTPHKYTKTQITAIHEWNKLKPRIRTIAIHIALEIVKENLKRQGHRPSHYDPKALRIEAVNLASRTHKIIIEAARQYEFIRTA
jgi:hypothetical protein